MLYSGAVVVLGVCVVASIGLWTTAAVATASKLALTRASLRRETFLAGAATVAMAAMTVLATIWWASVPGSSPERMLVLTLLMVTATSFATAGTVRSARALGASVSVVFETHSTSVDNELGIATGWNEGELSEAGRLQARCSAGGAATTASQSCSRPTCAVPSRRRSSRSPGRRCRSSCDSRLRECNYGTLNGMPRRPARGRAATSGSTCRSRAARAGARRSTGSAASCASCPGAFDGRRVLVIGHVATRWALDHFAAGVSLATLAETPFDWREGWEYTLHTDGGAEA